MYQMICYYYNTFFYFAANIFRNYCKRFMKDKAEDYKLFEVSQKLQRFIKEAEKNY